MAIEAKMGMAVVVILMCAFGFLVYHKFDLKQRALLQARIENKSDAQGVEQTLESQSQAFDEFYPETNGSNESSTAPDSMTSNQDATLLSGTSRQESDADAYNLTDSTAPAAVPAFDLSEPAPEPTAAFADAADDVLFPGAAATADVEPEIVQETSSDPFAVLAAQNAAATSDSPSDSVPAPEFSGNDFFASAETESPARPSTRMFPDEPDTLAEPEPASIASIDSSPPSTDIAVTDSFQPFDAAADSGSGSGVEVPSFDSADGAITLNPVSSVPVTSVSQPNELRLPVAAAAADEPAFDQGVAAPSEFTAAREDSDVGAAAFAGQSDTFDSEAFDFAADQPTETTARAADESPFLAMLEPPLNEDSFEEARPSSVDAGIGAAARPPASDPFPEPSDDQASPQLGPPTLSIQPDQADQPAAAADGLFGGAFPEPTVESTRQPLSPPVQLTPSETRKPNRGRQMQQASHPEFGVAQFAYENRIQQVAAVAEDCEICEVRANDNYWTISRRVYGTARYFSSLALYNRHRIPDPKKLRPGMKVLIPDPAVLEQQYPELFKDFQKKPQLPSGFFLQSDGTPAYRVGERETLSEISQKHLGRASRWMQIYRLNQHILNDPNSLKPGTILTLPDDATNVHLAP